MQNTTFLALLRLIFALKAKIAPPNGNENASTLTLDLEENSVTKLIPAWVKTSFFFFGFHLISDTKPFQFQVKTDLDGFIPPKQPPLQIPGYAPVHSYPA